MSSNPLQKKLWSGLTQELKGLSENVDIFITVLICSVSSNHYHFPACMQHFFSDISNFKKCTGTKIDIMIFNF